jgi:RNA polymerase sigma-70 factor (ECF subfamily)
MIPAAPDTSPEILLTTQLVQRAKQGDPTALDALMTRYLPRLYRWASGRLPLHARSLLDTTDLVHDTLLKAIQSLDRFEVRGPGGFQAYVRRAIQNRILDQIRWAGRRPGTEDPSENLVDPGRSPLENAIGADLFARYERARAQLRVEDQLFLHLRIELDFDYREIAAIMESPSWNAARMGVQRSLRRLVEIMRDEG